MVKCVDCKYAVRISVEYPMKPGKGIEPKTFRCSYSREDKNVNELNNERKCEGYEPL